MPGTFFVVATPIGHLEDITLRALRVLREVDVIAAEDTRITRLLLDHFEIETPLTSYHQHSGGRKAAALLRQLAAGRSVALVSDAGMPGISDPGHELIRLAIAAGVPVVPVPGATALVAALAASGLPTIRFSFQGFHRAPRPSGLRSSRACAMPRRRSSSTSRHAGSWPLCATCAAPLATATPSWLAS